MKVSELIEELKKMPQDCTVGYMIDKPNGICPFTLLPIYNVYHGVNEMDLMVILDDYIEEE